MHEDIQAYNARQEPAHARACDALAKAIGQHLPEAGNKLWHGDPVWFLDGNPIVGYSKEKPGIRLMFWSGADFDELQKARSIQWDYKNLAKRKGVLERIGA